MLGDSTFIVIVFAIVSVLIDGKLSGFLGISFIAFGAICRCCYRSIPFWQNIYGSVQSCSFTMIPYNTSYQY